MLAIDSDTLCICTPELYGKIKKLAGENHEKLLTLVHSSPYAPEGEILVISKSYLEETCPGWTMPKESTDGR